MLDPSFLKESGMKWTLRILWAMAGLFWFVWFGFEDRGIQMVVVVAVGFALPLGFQVFTAWQTSADSMQATWMLRSVLSGGIAGILVSPIAIVLVLIKVSLHQHEVPDFSQMDLQNLLQRIPFWLLTGLLFGAAGGVWGWHQKSSQ